MQGGDYHNSNRSKKAKAARKYSEEMKVTRREKPPGLTRAEKRRSEAGPHEKSRGEGGGGKNVGFCRQNVERKLKTASKPEAEANRKNATTFGKTEPRNLRKREKWENMQSLEGVGFRWGDTEGKKNQEKL